MTRWCGIRIPTAATSLIMLAACSGNAPGAAPAVPFGGTYVSNNRIGLMPNRIEFNGPRNCIVYTNGVAYAEGAIAPGSSATGPGPGSSAEGLCQPANGGMEFSTSSPFGGQTMYFRTVDGDTFSYQRRGQTIYLTRRLGGAASAQGVPPRDPPAGPPPDEPLATLGLTPSNPEGHPVTVTANPVTVGTENRTIQVPEVKMENRSIQSAR
jgi:hypothetical protein